MTAASAIRPAPFDATLRWVMRLDALWSTVAGLAWLVVLPAVALLDLPGAARTVTAYVALLGSVFLGGCGALTFVLLTIRMRRGHYLLPPGLGLPLPRPFRAWTEECVEHHRAGAPGRRVTAPTHARRTAGDELH